MAYVIDTSPIWNQSDRTTGGTAATSFTAYSSALQDLLNKNFNHVSQSKTTVRHKILDLRRFRNRRHSALEAFMGALKKGKFHLLKPIFKGYKDYLTMKEKNENYKTDKGWGLFWCYCKKADPVVQTSLYYTGKSENVWCAKCKGSIRKSKPNEDYREPFVFEM